MTSICLDLKFINNNKKFNFSTEDSIGKIIESGLEYHRLIIYDIYGVELKINSENSYFLDGVEFPFHFQIKRVLESYQSIESVIFISKEDKQIDNKSDIFRKNYITYINSKEDDLFVNQYRPTSAINPLTNILNSTGRLSNIFNMIQNINQRVSQEYEDNIEDEEDEEDEADEDEELDESEHEINNISVPIDNTFEYIDNYLNNTNINNQINSTDIEENNNQIEGEVNNENDYLLNSNEIVNNYYVDNSNNETNNETNLTNLINNNDNGEVDSNINFNLFNTYQGNENINQDNNINQNNNQNSSDLNSNLFNNIINNDDNSNMNFFDIHINIPQNNTTNIQSIINSVFQNQNNININSLNLNNIDGFLEDVGVTNNNNQFSYIRNIINSLRNRQQMEDVCIVMKEEDINTFISGKYGELKNSNSIESKSCSFSLEDFEDDSEILILPCKHCFSKDNIKKWLTESSNKCPVCRKEVGKGYPKI